ncbi:PDZ domain-containing protein [Trichonephila clavata]|uniref:PDZ domain-containing protein n=1 Tax=Trichonephila clavata TaxID=2740835 RepID=A0A8X6FHF3_TRICU|nr:PDZ domain-containing protein [Trichonephila clavata]
MASGIIEATLSRDAQSTPWGFRLHGGKDIGFPLVIQRVFMGSPSEGELHRGDTILQIQGRDTLDMTHMDAYDLIKAAGTKLQLLIRRLPGAPQTPLTPTSPLPTVDGMHPYAKLLRETEASRTSPKTPPPMFQPMSPPRMTPQPPRFTPQPPRYTPQPPRDYTSSPLPTTRTSYFTPTPKNLADVELVEYAQEKYKERDAMSNQGYRTLPLIAPKPKTRHDVPMGSYLRHTPDPNWKGRSAIGPSLPKFNAYPTPTYSTIGHYSRKPQGPPPGAPMFERPLNDSAQLVHHQYNSPMFLYSQKNIENTIQEQTGVSVKKPTLNVGNPLPPNQAGPLSPGTPGTLAPARPGTKLTNIVDITLSPTFQMIQEVENRSGSPLPEQRTPTLPRRAPGPGPAPGPKSFQEQINSFGVPKEVIHQSGSFKTLMSALYEQQA